MSIEQIDPVFASALREALVRQVEGRQAAPVGRRPRAAVRSGHPNLPGSPNGSSPWPHQPRRRPARRAVWATLVTAAALVAGTVALVSLHARGERVKVQPPSASTPGRGHSGHGNKTGSAATGTATRGAPAGTEVSAMSTSIYGSVLVWGGRKEGHGSFLYEFSGDANGKFGCTTRRAPGYNGGGGPLSAEVPAQSLLGMLASCTGPERDFLSVSPSDDDWPALTTAGAPVAGPGVDQNLLGTVDRRGIGKQVTYGGHPLYLFDVRETSDPLYSSGEGYVESVAPMYPWHGIWNLVSAKDGAPAPGPTTVGAEILPSKKAALAYVEFPDDYTWPLTVYSYSLDRGSVSACTGACAVTWMPLLTTGKPKVDYSVSTARIAAQKIGVIRRPDGTEQVTYEGKPLYLYSRERYVFVEGVQPSIRGSTGNGNGLRGPNGGTFSVVYLR